MPPPAAPADPDTRAEERARARGDVRRSRRKQAQRVVVAVVAVSALAAMFTAGEPTGNALADAVYRMGFAALVTAATSRARRWTWFVGAGAAGAVAGSSIVPLGLAALALLLAFGSISYGRRQRQLGAVVGALLVHSLLRLPTDVSFTVPTLTAVLAPVPLYVSALRNVRRPRRYLLAGALATVLLTIVGGVFVGAMASIEQRASGGIRAARAGLEAASAGDDRAAERAFARAEEELGAAADTADAWWLVPARATPVLAQHVRTVSDVAREGRAIAAIGADQAAVLDVDGLSRPGGFDLTAIGDLAPRAATVADALEDALVVLDDARSPWLVPPVVDRLDEFTAEVSTVAPAARTAADALAIAPQLLGADGPQRYVLLVANPAEARELGGFVAATGVLVADRGSFEFTASSSVPAVNARVAEQGLELTGDFPPPVLASQPERFLQNWANSADFSVVADVATQLGPAIADGPVDGVVYLDPYAIAALLELTGPVAIEERPDPLSADEAVDFLLRDQYLADDFATDGSRKDRLRDAAEAAFEQLTSTSLPDPRRMADVLSPIVRSRRLLFTTTDDGAHLLLEQVGLRPAFDTGAADQILVAHENLRANKLDAYLERHLTYDVVADENGTVAGTLTVELTNTAPPDGLPPYVTGDGSVVPDDPLPETTGSVSLDVYTSLAVSEVRLDGDAVSPSTAEIGRLARTSIAVAIPTQSTVTVTYSLSGTVEDYSLSVLPNAGAGVDTFAGTIERDGALLDVPREPLVQPFRFVN